MLFGCKRPCAYCLHHHFTMSVKQVKYKKCLDKQCHHLKKLDHAWWEQRDTYKQLRKERKKQLNDWLNDIGKGDAQNDG